MSSPEPTMKSALLRQRLIVSLPRASLKAVLAKQPSSVNRRSASSKAQKSAVVHNLLFLLW